MRDLAVIPLVFRKKIGSFAFNDIHKYASPFTIEELQKLQGYENFYRIRFGDYRVGIRLEEDEVVLERVLHRKEIYRYFP